MKRSLVAIATIIFLASSAWAAPQKLCLKESGQIISKKRCRDKKNEVLLGAENLASLLGGGNCEDCLQDLSGEWLYYYRPAPGGPNGIDRTVNITQTGNSFTGENNSHVFAGSVHGTTFDMIQVVSGEVTEGFVRHIQGSYYQFTVGMRTFTRLLGFYQDSNGGSGSFVARLQ